METFTIRLAGEGDLDTVTELLVVQLREHDVATPADAIRRAAARVLGDPERGRIFVACVGGPPVGIAALSFAWPLEHGGRSAWLEELYVVPAHRGRGIGRALLLAACDAAAAAGAVAVDLEVDAGHGRARTSTRARLSARCRAGRWVRRLV